VAIVGYARVSSIGQSLEVQLDRLAHCDKVYQDQCSGTTAARPAFQACLDFVRAGDFLVVTHFDRLARSTFQGAMGQVGFDHIAGGQAMGDMQQGKLSSYVSNDLNMNGGHYSALQARSTAVNTVGTDRDHEAAAERAGISYGDSAIGAISQSAGENHVGALARRDMGSKFFGDPLAPAAREAKFGVARTAATDDVVGAFKAAQGVDDGAALRGAFQVLGAGEIAKADECGGTLRCGVEEQLYTDDGRPWGKWFRFGPCSCILRCGPVKGDAQGWSGRNREVRNAQSWRDHWARGGG